MAVKSISHLGKNGAVKIEISIFDDSGRISSVARLFKDPSNPKDFLTYEVVYETQKCTIEAEQKVIARSLDALVSRLISDSEK